MENSGVPIVWNINALLYLQNNQLQLVLDSVKMPIQEMYLLARKNNSFNSVLKDIKEELVSIFE